MKRFFYLCVILTLFCAASIASADTITMTYLGETDAVGVTIKAPGFPSVGTTAGTATFESGGITFRGYCVEAQTISPNTTATYNVAPIAEGTIYEAVAFILSQNYTGITDAPAAQIAVWELVFDYAASPSNSYSLSLDNFQLLGGSINTTRVAEIYQLGLNNMGSGGFNPSGFYMLASNNNLQDFTICNPNPVPLPGAILLLGAGMARLVAYARRRQD